MIPAKGIACLPARGPRLEELESREVPAVDLRYALQLNGLSPTAYSRVGADAIGNAYIAATFTGTVDLDPSPTRTFYVTSRGGTDVLVAKYGYYGDLIWGRSLGGTGNDTAADIAFDGAGNVYTAGTFTGTVDFNPGTPAVNLTAAAAGSAFVWKLDFYGNLVFAKSIEGASRAGSIATDSRGNLFLSGQFAGTADFNPSPTATDLLTSTNPFGSAFAWRLDSTGNHAWARAFHTTGSIDAGSIAADGAGNVYLAGGFTGTADFDPGSTTFAIAAGTASTPFAVKLGSSGNLLWADAARVISTPTGAVNRVTGLNVDSQGNVYLAGEFAGALDFDPLPGVTTQTSNAASVDGFVWKLDYLGRAVWSRRFGGAANDTVTDLGMDQAGNTFTIGRFSGVADFDPNSGLVNLRSGPLGDTYLLRLSNLGNFVYVRGLGGATGTVSGQGAWADGAGNVYMIGGFAGAADFDPLNPGGVLTGGLGAGFLVKLLPDSLTALPVVNASPTASAGGAYTINEGQGLTVAATASDPEKDPLTYSWDINGDGIYGDAVGAIATLTPARMAALGLDDSRPAPITVRVRVSDGKSDPTVAATTLTINNIPPGVRISTFASAYQWVGTSVQVVPVGDPSAADARAGFRYSYDFDNNGVFDVGGGSYASSVTNTYVTAPGLMFRTPGPQTIRVRIFDKDGGFSDATFIVQVIAHARPSPIVPYVYPWSIGYGW